MASIVEGLAIGAFGGTILGAGIGRGIVWAIDGADCECAEFVYTSSEIQVVGGACGFASGAMIGGFKGLLSETQSPKEEDRSS